MAVATPAALAYRLRVEEQFLVSELGDEYELFLYFDGGAYQVKVVSPDVEDGLSPHDCHLFADGRICLGDLAGGGMPTLEEAYARSVVWCNGFSVYLQNGKFPF